jgi:MoxR-like ATPase
MQELSVTVRGEHHTLEPPFLVLATQNPIELEGTYPLPEAQLDRFLFNVLLDYLDTDEELAVVDRFTTRVDVPEVSACTNADEVVKFQWLVRQVPVAESVNRYAINLVRSTRPREADAPDVVKRYVNFGASVRATMFLILAAKASALLGGRYHVTQDDVRSMALPVLRHRVLCNYYAESDNMTVDDVLAKMLGVVGG